MHLEGQFNFNHTPLAPPGTYVLNFEDTDTQASWNPYGKEDWYLGPVLEHYQCPKFYVPVTKGVSVSSTIKCFPVHCKVPKITTTDTAITAANDLLQALQKPFPELPNLELETNHYTVLKELEKIFNNATKK